LAAAYIEMKDFMNKYLIFNIYNVFDWNHFIFLFRNTAATWRMLWNILL